MINSVEELKIKLFADGANKDDILQMYKKPYIKGFTTNPTLMRKAGVTDYKGFALDLLSIIQDLPISFEVFSDDLNEMESQANLISSWGENVFVKIPITNTEGISTVPIIKSLSKEKVKLNITAMMTVEQVKLVSEVVKNSSQIVLSVFAGRIADTGYDPIPLMQQALELINPYPKQELLWASPRELLNIIQADMIGCHIITATTDVLKKIDLIGKDLTEYSLDTVKMFRGDAINAGFHL
ncbi:MAG: transaldolase [Anaerolineaceae bacterium]|nr:transaldolase [Anaerolineaceae bacterium]